MRERPALTSTYRLQLHAGFGFADAAAIVPYLEPPRHLAPLPLADPAGRAGLVARLRRRRPLARVGRPRRPRRTRASSQPLRTRTRLGHRRGRRAEPHGDPRPRASQPGRSGRCCGSAATAPDRALVRRRLGAGRRAGSDSRSSARRSRRCSRPGEIDARTTTAAEPVLRYADHCFPVAPGSELGRAPRRCSPQQHYALASWREKDRALNYRRFFDVDTLIAIRVELDDVFDATHAVLIELYASGVIDGFRIDHPDGLADPQGYLERLRDADRRGLGRSSRRSSRPARRFPPPGPARARRATTRPARSRRRSCLPSPPSWTSAGRQPVASRRSSAWRSRPRASSSATSSSRRWADSRAPPLRRLRRRAARSIPRPPQRRCASCSPTSRCTAPTCVPGTRPSRPSSSGWSGCAPSRSTPGPTSRAPWTS